LNAIAQMRRTVPGEVFDYQVLLGALAGYRKPRDRITRLLANGTIVRVKKGGCTVSVRPFAGSRSAANIWPT